ncbi:MAG TPA: GNAT family N-acetyltransferase [Pyrinomonadaceae bacterium]|nr:GNAT family N-acetyltransferase [Pyrinomonadaceae bacterium]
MASSAGSQEQIDGLSLRLASPADDEFLLRLYGSTRLEELNGLGWDEQQKQAFILMQFIAQRRCYPEAENQIVLLHQKAIGRMLVRRTDDAVLLVDISLIPEHRNMGIGSVLLKQLQQEAIAKQKPVQLHVLKTSAALRLYERLAFVKIGEDGAYLEMVWSPLSS